jgi:anaerobic magnesium-protoporphyrin IX monomethyl ester cyclase
MNILLICPTWTDDLGVFGNIAKKRNSQPPLGILYIASVAQKRGHYVEMIDSDVEDFTRKTLVEHVLKGNWDMVGITATSPIFHKAVELAKDLKEKNFSKPILIGGEHMNIFKKEALFDCFDYGFFGESDRTFDQFLAIYETGSRDFKEMTGFVYRENGKHIETPEPERIKDLDTLSFPDLSLLNHKKYVMSFAKYKKRHYMPIIASRGCPYKCTFCSEPLTNPVVRFRSAKNIVDEMEYWLNNSDITHFFFLDSNITIRKQQAEGICNEIINRKLKLTWEGWTRANLVTKDMLILLKKSGFIRMSYGLESGDAEVLKIIKKEVKHEDMVNAIRMTSEVGIEPACSLMLGLPGDTKEKVEKTIEFVRNIPEILYTNFSIANPYPGTEMFEQAQTGMYGIKSNITDFSEYRRYDKSPITCNDMTAEELVKMQKIGLVRIHFTPRRILAAMRILGITVFPLFIRMVLVLFKETILSIKLGSLFSQKRKSEYKDKKWEANDSPDLSVDPIYEEYNTDTVPVVEYNTTVKEDAVPL